MFKYFLVFLLSLNISFANENVVKTSELELFLFKVGFESLLKDVDTTKDKSKLNATEIKSINEKVELIMAELYKDKRVIFNDSNEINTISKIDKEELDTLKNEIAFLKKEVKELKNTSVVKITKEEPKNEVIKIKELNKVIVNKIKLEKSKTLKAITTVNNARVRIYPSIDAKIIKELPSNKIIYLDYCDRFGWCKFQGKKEYIAQQILWIYK